MELLIVNDSEIMYRGLKTILELEKDIKLVAHATNKNEAIDKAINGNPSVILLALDSDNSNLNLCNELHTVKPSIKVLVLSSSEKSEQAIEFLKLGASSIIEKEVAARDLINAIRLVARGQTFMPSTVTNSLKKQVVGGSIDYKDLTLREVEILQGIASGFSNKEIAHNYQIGETTVKTHLRHILKKLDVTNRTSAVLYAYENKWIKINKRNQ